MPLIPWSVRRSRGDPREHALRLAMAGEPEGTTVARSGRHASVEFSSILRPKPDSPVHLLRLIAAFCTSEGIRKDTGIISWIRWPDVVVAGGSAVATTETTFGPGKNPEWIILFVRVNNAASTDAGTTSLYDLLGTEVDERLLMEKILESLDWMYYGFSRGMHDHIVQRVRSMTDTIGKRVEITLDGRSIVGRASDVDDLGRLVVALGARGKSLRVEFGESVREL